MYISSMAEILFYEESYEKIKYFNNTHTYIGTQPYILNTLSIYAIVQVTPVNYVRLSNNIRFTATIIL